MKTRSLVLAALAVVAAGGSAGASTSVCGPYSTNQTWTTSGSPYIVTCDVTISGSAAPILTINAGVTVQFNSGYRLTIGGGAPGGINVQGTSGSHVTLTSSSGTPHAGDWYGVVLNQSAISTLAMTYADVLYSAHGIYYGVTGAATLSNIKVQNSSGYGFQVVSGTPTLSAATLSTNQWGLYVTGGTATVSSSSTISSNTAGGIYVATPASVSLQSVTISNNTGFAISSDAGVTFGTMSSVTATGNTTNGVEVRFSTVTSNATWKSFGLPYVTTNNIGVGAASSPTLTISAGVTVKFCQNCNLVVGYSTPGTLSAVGTAALPITFTANGSTSPGFWQGLQFFPGTTASSILQYATVSYSTGIVVQSASPTVDHTTLSTNTAGLTTTSATPIVRNCTFTGNTSGFVNNTPATVVDARMNWWNSNLGPSGSGPGTGQSVSTGVSYEPWLGAAGSNPQYFTAFSLGNSTFNPTTPNPNILANFSFTATASGTWTLKIYTSPTGTLIRTISGSGITGSPSWDGKNDGGTLQGNATYTYQIDSTAGSNAAAPLRGRVTLNTALQLTVSNLLVAPLYFSPNADGIQDTTTISATSSFDGASWTLTIKNSGGATVATASGAATPNLSYTWNGSSQNDGVYTLVLTVTDGTGSVQNSPTVTLDKIAPTATITAPASGALLSNLTQSGSANVTVTGTASDTNMQSWTLDFGAGASPSSWTVIGSGTTNITAGTLGTWQTLSLANGLYTLRLTGNDLAGNKITTSRQETIANFSVSQNVLQFNGSASQTVTYTSIIPAGITGSLTETLTIKSGSTTIKTLFSGAVTGGTSPQVSWDGKNTSGVLQVDGPYTYIATFSNGTSNMTWDLTTQYLNDGHSYGTLAAFPANFALMPFNNAALPITYTIPAPPTGPVRMTLLFSPTSYDAAGPFPTSANCNDTGNWCQFADMYQEGGVQRFYLWDGLDPTGTLRSDILTLAVVGDRTHFSKNAVMLYGTRPTLSNLLLTPPQFYPGSGSLAVTATTTSYQSAAVTLSLTVTNLTSHTVLRTITQANQPAGASTVNWDGKADNGMWVSPGPYALTLTVTDSKGQADTQALLATVGY